MSNKNIKTYISSHSSFSGTVSNVEHLVVDGKFEGTTLEAKNLFVGKTGKVKANILAEYAVVEGIVLGNIKANIRLILMPSARILGKIETREIIIQKGALFEGQCIILNDSVTTNTKEHILNLYKTDE